MNRIVIEQRASSILYGLAHAQKAKKQNAESIWLLPSNVCPIVPLTLIAAGMTFEFVDICPRTLCMDPDIAIQRLTDPHVPAVAALIYVRTYGNRANRFYDLDKIKSATKHNFLLIDDQALCPPVTRWDEIADTPADVTLFSTGYGKVVNLDFGGYAFFSNNCDYTPVQSDIDLLQKLYESRYKNSAIVNLFQKAKQDSICNIQAQKPLWLKKHEAPLSWKEMKQKIDENWNEIRQHKMTINALYENELSGFVILDSNFQQWRFNLMVENAEELVDHIFKMGLFASRHYMPLEDHFEQNTNPVAKDVSEKIVNLFNDTFFSVEQATDITKHINDFSGKFKKV